MKFEVLHILTNRIAIISFILAFPYFFIFGYFNLRIAAFAVLPTLLICCSILIFNKYRLYKTASIITIFGITTVVLFYSLHLGFNSGAHLIFFPLIAWPFILFSDRDRFLKYSALAFLIFCVLINHFFRIYFLTPDELLLPYGIAKIIYFIATFTSISFITATILLFYKSEIKIRNKLESSIKRLNNNYERIKKMTKKIRELKQAMESDIEKGKKLQDSSLPQKPPLLDNVTISHAFEPAKHLSGDYFDYYPNYKTATVIPLLAKDSPINEDDEDILDEEPQLILKQVGIVVADVVGKGVAASLEMFSVKTVFKLLHESWFNPKKLVTLINQMATDSHLFSKYVPLIYATLTQLDATKYKLTYVNAGHEYGVIVKANSNTILLDQGGAPAGMDPNEVYAETHFILEKGDTVFLFTDGCTDVKSPSEECIGIDELISILKEAAHQDKNDIAKYVRNRLKDFQGNAPQADDITIVAIQIG
jgi:serine phosphatase RsbU (regulator of sigma subunit)